MIDVGFCFAEVSLNLMRADVLVDFLNELLCLWYSSFTSKPSILITHNSTPEFLRLRD